MSTDEAMTKDVMETLEDGQEGYSKGADKLDELTEGALAETFRGFAGQRTTFADELQGMAKAYGDDPDRSGSAAAAVHRGWMSLKETLSGSDTKAILEVAEQGDDHAIGVYEKALEADISAGLRDVLDRQLSDVRAARDVVAGLAGAR